MAYILGQYNKNRDVHDDNDYMTLITNGSAERKAASSGILEEDDNPFVDECVKIPSTLEVFKNYYFHGKIKKLKDPQTFHIKLGNFEDGEERIEQYVKTLTIPGGANGWVDVEFVFTPMATFDIILFDLVRTIDDYRTATRYPVIAYQELSQIENLITRKIKASGTSLIKIGVQSRPGLMMCINGEEIRTSRTGVYELKNGTILVTFFSITAAAQETTTEMKEWMDQVDEELADHGSGLESVHSNCFFGTTKERTIDSFTLDYMYREEETS